MTDTIPPVSNEMPKKLHPKGSGKSVMAWCFYDWANTAFGTVIITFVFSVFFTRGMIGDETQGSAMWSYAIGFSGLIIAILGPLFGAAADHAGDRKRWIFWLSMLCIVPTALLWFAQPDNTAGNVFFVLACVVIANVGFELGQVFYNAMLPHIAPPHMIGRISGWAWGLGYLGGLAALVLALVGLVGIGGMEPLLPISGADSANIRATGPMAALWFLIFMIPMFVWTRDIERAPVSFMGSMSAGWRQLRQTLREIRHHGNIVTFLISSAIYRDGLVTLFAIGGVYAAGQFGMDFQEILIFAIGLNVMAGLGAFGFAWLDDWLGSRTTAIVSLAGLILTGLAILFTSDKHVFMGLAYGLGLFIGPVQAASRTLAGRLAPPGMVNQTYGLYAFTGKSVSFLGPLLYGWATTLWGSQQAGMMSIILFWIAGAVLLCFVREEKSAP